MAAALRTVTVTIAESVDPDGSRIAWPNESVPEKMVPGV
jgi:hypothetical protein